jgi:UDP-GlcNAc:undecaprenyl-phosphate/decaprenyl-phosphate GlcNAc-1-phosphate transferase
MERLIILTLVLNIPIFFFYERLSKFINIFDYPSKRKIHSKPTPIMGGIIIYTNIFFFFNYIIFFDSSLQSILIIENTKGALSFFLTFSLIFFLGLYDDKFDSSPNMRLILLSIFIFNFLYFNPIFLIDELKFSFLSEIISLNKVSFLFTFCCILVFVISMNMFDGTNLQSVSFYLFLIIYLINKSLVFNLFLFFIFIPILLFAIKNFQGKAFLGDGGTYLISFIFSLIVIKNHYFNNIESDEIALVLLLPILDTVRLYFARILDNKNPFLPDKNHFHHIILNKFKGNFSIFIITFSFVLPLILLKIFNNSLISILIFLIFYFFIILKFNKNKVVK